MLAGKTQRQREPDGDGHCASGLRHRLELWNERVGESGLFWSLTLLYICSQLWFFAYGVKYELDQQLAPPTGRYFAVVGRGFGYVATYNALLLPITSNRTLATLLYRVPLYDILSVGRWLPELHSMIAWSLAITGWLHGIALTVVVAIGTLPFRGGFFQNSDRIPTTMVFATGVALMVMLPLVNLLSLERVRRRVYRVFWASHVPLAILVYVALIFHGLRGGRPWTVYFFAGPLALYFLDRFYHAFAAAFTPHKVRSVRISNENSNVVRLEAERAGRTFVAGQYFKLAWRSSWDARLSVVGGWHPFTVASSPQHEKDTMVFFAAAVGRWTNALKALAESEDGGARADAELGTPRAPVPAKLRPPAAVAAARPPEVRKDYGYILMAGPYGAPAQSHQNFMHQVLIGAGVGATPMVSIVRELCSMVLPDPEPLPVLCFSEAEDAETDEAAPTLPEWLKKIDVDADSDGAAGRLSSADDTSTVSAIEPCKLLRRRLHAMQGITRLGRFSAVVLSNLWLFSILWTCLVDLTLSTFLGAFSKISAFIASLFLFLVILGMITLTVFADMRLSSNPPYWRYLCMPRGLLLFLWYGVAITNAVLCSLLVANYFELLGTETEATARLEAYSWKWMFVVISTPLHIALFVLLLFFFFLPRSWTWSSTPGVGFIRRHLLRRGRHRDDRGSAPERDPAWSRVRTITFLWVVRHARDLWFLDTLYELAEMQFTRDARRPRLCMHIYITRPEVPEGAEANSALPADCGDALRFFAGRPDFTSYMEELMDQDGRADGDVDFALGDSAIGSLGQFHRTRVFSNKVRHGVFLCGNDSIVDSVRQSLRDARSRRRTHGKPPRNVFFMRENF